MDAEASEVAVAHRAARGNEARYVAPDSDMTGIALSTVAA
jgi:hypothetical protein